MRRCRMLLSVSYTCNFRSLFQFHGVVNFGLLPGKQSLPLQVSLQLSIDGADSGNFAMLCVVTPSARTRARRRHHHSLASPPPRSCPSALRPSVFSCSFLTITSSVGRLGHAAQAQVPLFPSLGRMPFYAGRLSARAQSPPRSDAKPLSVAWS